MISITQPPRPIVQARAHKSHIIYLLHVAARLSCTKSLCTTRYTWSKYVLFMMRWQGPKMSLKLFLGTSTGSDVKKQRMWSRGGAGRREREVMAPPIGKRGQSKLYSLEEKPPVWFCSPRLNVCEASSYTGEPSHWHVIHSRLTKQEKYTSKYFGLVLPKYFQHGEEGCSGQEQMKSVILVKQRFVWSAVCRNLAADGKFHEDAECVWDGDLKCFYAAGLRCEFYRE